MKIHDISVKDAKGVEKSLHEFEGKVLLIVNTASECGFTPQYDGLEKLHEEFFEKGLRVLGFPCNQFGGQEPGTDAEIQSFCETRFGLKFPVFAKVEVNGPGEHPLFRHLKSEAPGMLGSTAIKWNFTKFLVSRSGEVLDRFAPMTKPESIRAAIEKALG